jgi:hypothetical protein
MKISFHNSPMGKVVRIGVHNDEIILPVLPIVVCLIVALVSIISLKS